MTDPLPTLSNRGRWQTFLFFTAASLAAVLLGSATLAATKVPFGSWSRNPIAWLVGLVLALGLMRLRNLLPVSKPILGLALVAVAGSFLAPAQHGVHRWIDLGPLHVNVAVLLLPLAVVALAYSGTWSRTALTFIAAMGALLVLQPDASQATSFLLAVIILFARSTAPPARRILTIAAAVVVAAISWTRPDPLQPVAEVEGIFRLAFTISPVLAAVAALALAAASLSPFAIRAASSTKRTAALALTGYFISAAVCPAFGAFPVPLVGLGMSFPVGYWLGIALVCAKGSSIYNNAATNTGT
jgi:hypothetical protein